MEQPKRKLMRVTPIKKESDLKEKKIPDFFQKLKLYFIQYCESTTVHGVRYIGERGRYLLEKLVWTVIVVVVCTFCLILVYQTYRKWKSSPVIVSFATRETSISKIPFPAVTICPEVKFDPDIFNFTDVVLRKLKNRTLTNDEKENLLLSSLVCSNAMEYDNLFPNSNWNLTKKKLDKLMNMTPYFDPLQLTTIKWLGKTLQLNASLSKTLTSVGYCYTFNSLPYEKIVRYEKGFNDFFKPSTKSNKWTLDGGYPEGESFDAFPRRTFMAGLEGGLSISSIFTNNSHLDYMCGESLQGFKVALHHPYEFPSMESYIRLPLNQGLLVSIRPEMITVSPELWNYSPQDRKCYFADERYLISYKIYTQQNCLQECLANYTRLQCKCIPFYYALLEKNVKMCGPADYDCVLKTKLKYLEIESYAEKNGDQCDCLPLCTSLSYHVEASQADWKWYNIIHIFESIKELEALDINVSDINLSKLNVYYKNLQFLSCERNELYGLVDFFSNIGGLLGLFLGFSVTSVIEIIYFCTLRVLCNFKMKGRCAWSGDCEVTGGR